MIAIREVIGRDSSPNISKSDWVKSCGAWEKAANENIAKNTIKAYFMRVSFKIELSKAFYCGGNQFRHMIDTLHLKKVVHNTKMKKILAKKKHIAKKIFVSH